MQIKFFRSIRLEMQGLTGNKFIMRKIIIPLLITVFSANAQVLVKKVKMDLARNESITGIFASGKYYFARILASEDEKLGVFGKNYYYFSDQGRSKRMNSFTDVVFSKTGDAFAWAGQFLDDDYKYKTCLFTTNNQIKTASHSIEKKSIHISDDGTVSYVVINQALSPSSSSGYDKYVIINKDIYGFFPIIQDFTYTKNGISCAFIIEDNSEKYHIVIHTLSSDILSCAYKYGFEMLHVDTGYSKLLKEYIRWDSLLFSEAFDKIINLHFTPDGKKINFFAQKDTNWYFFNGTDKFIVTEGNFKIYKDPDQHPVAYSFELKNELLYWNDQPMRVFDEGIDKLICVNIGNENEVFLYGFRKFEQSFVYFIDKTYGPFSKIGDCLISPTNKSFLSRNYTDNTEYIVHNEFIYGPYKGIIQSDFINISDTICYLAEENNSRYIYKEGRKIGESKNAIKVAVSLNSDRFITAEVEDGKKYIITSEGRYGPYSKILDIAISDDGSTASWTAKLENYEYGIFCNGKMLQSYGWPIEKLTFIPGLPIITFKLSDNQIPLNIVYKNNIYVGTILQDSYKINGMVIANKNNLEFYSF